MRAPFRRLRTQSSPPTTHLGPRTPRARRKSRDGTGLTLRAAIPATLQSSACLRPKEPPCTFFGKAPIPQTQERPPRAEEQSGGTPERRHRQEAQSAQGRMRWPDESGIWNGGRRKPQSSRAGRGVEGREIQKYCCGDLRKTGRTRSVTHERPCGRPASSGTRRCGSRRGVSGLPSPLAQVKLRERGPAAGVWTSHLGLSLGAAQHVRPHGSADHAAWAGRLRWVFRTLRSQCPRLRRCRP